MIDEEKHALNRTLYRRIRATFGNVKIRNAGEKQMRKLTTDLVSGKPRTKITHAGEYYAICCPFCNDTRYRCYINHMYGREDELGRAQTFLATCYNAGCSLSMKDLDTYQKLEEMLTGHKLFQLQKAEIREGKEIDVDKIRASWPGDVVRLDKLPADHEAVVYLAGRGFDPELIGRFYNVHYCVQSNHFICEHRLIIPIYHKKKMVGWQARAAYDCNWKESYIPKYYTAPGTPRRQILYNFGNACRYQTGVVVEGVTDVWKTGPQAVCTLGATMTMQQQTLFVKWFKDYSGILFYDPDLKHELKVKLYEMVAILDSKLKSGFCWVMPPEGTDPGSLDRSFIRPYISQEAEQQGVAVNWGKR